MEEERTKRIGLHERDAEIAALVLQVIQSAFGLFLYDIYMVVFFDPSDNKG